MVDKEEHMPAYKIAINYANKSLWKLSKRVFLIGFVLFIAWLLIAYPAKYLPDVIQIHYFFELLPRWILNIPLAAMALFLVGWLLSDIRQNKSGLLKVYDDMIFVESKKRCDRIYIDELLRINVIKKANRFRPYRIEFVYKNFEFVRVAFSSEALFFEAFKHVIKLTPEGLEVNETNFESSLPLAGD